MSTRLENCPTIQGDKTTALCKAVGNDNKTLLCDTSFQATALVLDIIGTRGHITGVQYGVYKDKQGRWSLCDQEGPLMCDHELLPVASRFVAMETSEAVLAAFNPFPITTTDHEDDLDVDIEVCTPDEAA